MVVAEEKLKLYVRVYTAIFIIFIFFFFFSNCGIDKLIMNVPNYKEPCNELGSSYMNL